MTSKDLVIIDWLSPAPHENFNRSFLEAFSDSYKRMYVFEEYRSLKGSKISYLPRAKGRARQAAEVLRLVAKQHRNDPILLLSYDVKFIPLLRPYFGRLFVYEHNTTPERGARKHVIWQWLLTRRLRRLTQFPQQHDRLTELNQNSAWLGSPLVDLRTGEAVSPTDDPKIFLLPSYRSDPTALEPFLPLLKGATLQCKSADARFMSVAERAGINLEIRNRLDFQEGNQRVSGVIVAVPSPIRGSGWVNDAIGHHVPVLSASEQASAIIGRTFPKLDFLRLSELGDQTAFDQALSHAAQQDYGALIMENNVTLHRNFVGGQALSADC